jgi:acetyltransferase-like isoleucine patch superfamily enzyme
MAIPDLTSDDPRVTIGVGTYASSPPLLRPHHANNRIVIGKYCSFAHEVTIFSGGNHPMHFVSMHPLKLYFDQAGMEDWARDCGDEYEVTTIGSDVWLGHGATILGGVNVGDGAVIGSRAVVGSDVPPYGVVAGNPAKLVRKRFSEVQIAALLKLQWWHWPREKIERASRVLCSARLDELLEFASRN